MRLAPSGGRWLYEEPGLRVTLTRDWLVVDAASDDPGPRTTSLRPAAEMAIVLKGVERSLPFLLLP